MGVVYEAFDKERGETVALKVLRHVSAHGIYRFKREFRALQGLAHENLVRLGELTVADEDWFFTMELIHGQDLVTYLRGPSESVALGTPTADTRTLMPLIARGSQPNADDDTDEAGEHTGTADAAADAGTDSDNDDDVVRADSAGDIDAFGQTAIDGFPRPPVTLDLAELRRVFVQLVAGLRVLHAAGKVHRDIKPENIMVTDEGRVVLLDFGLILELDPEDWRATERTPAGTLAYMAPEQTNAGPVGPAADWYGVGVLLYQALTGELPYTGSALVLVQAKQSPPERSARELWPECPDDLGELCEQLLQVDPAARPDADTIARCFASYAEGSETFAHATQVAEDAGAETWVPEGLELCLGRDLELAQLAAAHSEVNAEDGAVSVVISGESGIGKSALLRHFTGRVQSEGAVLLGGRCYEYESVPYKALDGVIDALSGYLKSLPDSDVEALLPEDAALLPRLFPVFGRVRIFARMSRNAQRPAGTDDGQWLRGRAFAALRALLQALAVRVRLVLVIDDIQWADEDSAELLTDLLRPPGSPPLLLLLSRRTGVESSVELSLPGRVRTIALQPLSHDDARELARRLVGDDDEALIAQHIADEAQGHPLYISELVRHVGDHRSGPLRLDAAIWSRAQRLPDEARTVLGLLAIAGAPLTEATVQRAAGLGAGPLARALTFLRSEQMVRRDLVADEAWLEPYHDRVRESVASHLHLGKRRVMHDALADALAAEASPERSPLRVQHLEAAGRWEEAAELAERAADEAVVALAFEHATDLYRDAVRLASRDRSLPQDAPLYRKLADTLKLAGAEAAAGEVYRQLGAHTGEPRERDAFRGAAAECFLASGRVDEGVAALRQALADSDIVYPESDSQALRLMLWYQFRASHRLRRFRARPESSIAAEDLQRLELYQNAFRGLVRIDSLRGGYFAARGLVFALERGAARYAGVFWTCQAIVSSMMGTSKHARAKTEIAAAARALAHTSDELSKTHLLLAGTAYALFATDFRQVHARLDTLDRALERLGVHSFEYTTALVFRGLSWNRQLNAAALVAHMPQHLAAARRRGDLYSLFQLEVVGNLRWLVLDRPSTARRELEEAQKPPTEPGNALEWHALVARCQVALYDGRRAPLVAVQDEVSYLRQRSPLRFVQHVRIEMTWFEARLALLDARARFLPTRVAARRKLRRHASALGGEGLDLGHMYEHTLLGGLAEIEGERAVASSHLARAADAAERMGAPVWADLLRLRQDQLDGARATEAEERLRAQGVVDPHRLANLALHPFGR